MIIDKNILDNLTVQAKSSPRLRIAFDLRNTPEDGIPADAERTRARDGDAYTQAFGVKRNRGFASGQDMLAFL